MKASTHLKIKRFFFVSAVIVSVFCLVAYGVPMIFDYFHLSINISPSHVPCGVYKDIIYGNALKTHTFKKGEIIAFNYSTFCNRFPYKKDCRYIPQTNCFIKYIGGTSGDLITIAKSGNVCVNGTELPGTQLLRYSDGLSRVKIKYPYKVPVGELFLIAPFTLNSYDSRYFGSVPQDMVYAIKEKVFVW